LIDLKLIYTLTNIASSVVVANPLDVARGCVI